MVAHLKRKNFLFNFPGRVLQYRGTLEWRSQSRLPRPGQSQHHSLCESGISTLINLLCFLSLPLSLSLSLSLSLTLSMSLSLHHSLCKSSSLYIFVNVMEVGFKCLFLTTDRRPEKRRAPISVDHKLRKHALDFWRGRWTTGMRAPRLCQIRQQTTFPLIWTNILRCTQWKSSMRADTLCGFFESGPKIWWHWTLLSKNCIS